MEYYWAIKKEWNWVICRDVDGPRDCYIEWNKSEREKPILYVNAYIWNLETWYRCSYSSAKQKQQHRCREQCMDIGGDG